MSANTLITTFVNAMLGALVGMFLLLPLGLVVAAQVIFPLALALAALLAALGAGWAATRLAQDGTRTRLLPVVGAVEGVALVMALVVMAVPDLWARLDGPVGMTGIAVVSLLLAVAATIAAGRYRHPAQTPANDMRLTLLLLGAAVGVIIVVFGLAAALGLTGA